MPKSKTGGRPRKTKPGPLSADEKIYIAEHFLKIDADKISRKLQRPVAVIERYIEEKLRPKEKPIDTTKENFIVKQDYTEKTGTATVMTENASKVPIKLNNTEKNPFSTR